MQVEKPAAIELSEAELDVVAGGADFLFDFTQFNSDTLLISQNTQSGPNGTSTSSTIARQTINTSAIHYVALGV